MVYLSWWWFGVLLLYFLNRLWGRENKNTRLRFRLRLRFIHSPLAQLRADTHNPEINMTQSRKGP